MADLFSSLKGFVSYGALVDNAAGVVAPIGELSGKSATYAKDQAKFVGTTNTSPTTGSLVTVFSCQSPTDEAVSVPQALADLLMEVSNWMYGEAVDGAFDGTTETFRVAFENQFGSKSKNLTVGAMKASSSGVVWLPTSITFFIESTEIFGATPPAGFEECSIRLWMADAEFQQQYDEYDLAIIAPVDDLDSLFNPPSQVAAALKARTQPELFLKIDQAAGNSPYTVLRSFQFSYHYLGSPTQTAPAYWTFIVWSSYGDNVDTLKQRLAEWILANSTHTRAEWEAIFPDIFSSAEYIITPLFNQYSIPNITLDNAMYSPIVGFEDALTFMKGTAAGDGYTEAHVAANSNFMSMAYKSLACIAVGNVENANPQLINQIPDYIAVPSTSIDFDRMSSDTRIWCYQMWAMIKAAEAMTPYSDLPSGMSRLTRKNADGNDVLYVVASINNMLYLVTSRYSLNTLYPPVDHTSPAVTFTPDPTVTLSTPIGSKRLQMSVAATGGTPPFTYSAASNDIENGGTIDPTTGVLDVTFREWGTNQITITAIDSKGFPNMATYVVISTES